MPPIVSEAPPSPVAPASGPVAPAAGPDAITEPTPPAAAAPVATAAPAAPAAPAATEAPAAPAATEAPASAPAAAPAVPAEPVAPAAPAAPATPDAPAQRRWWLRQYWRGGQRSAEEPTIFTRREKANIWGLLLAFSLIFSLMAMALILMIHLSGYQKQGGSTIWANDMYMIMWTKRELVQDNPADASTQHLIPFTMMFYLNAFCVYNVSFLNDPGTCLYHDGGRNFDTGDIDNLFDAYFASGFERDPTGANPAAIPVPGNPLLDFNSSSSGGSTVSPRRLVQPMRPALPRGERVTVAPSSLAIEKRYAYDPVHDAGFVGTMFSGYVLALVVICIAWFAHALREFRPNFVRRPIALGIIYILHFIGLLGVLIGAGSLQANAQPLADYASTQDRFVNGTSSTDDPGYVGKNFTAVVWTSALAQLLAVVVGLAAEWIRPKKDQLFAPEPARPTMARGLPQLIRPRPAQARRVHDPEAGDDELPTYERNDPLGRPPSLEGRDSQASSGGAECIPMQTLDSSGSATREQSQPSGHQTEPTPEYSEHDTLHTYRAADLGMLGIAAGRSSRRG